MSQQSARETQPWWQFGHVWLVISGPAIVVVASFITLYLALTRVDPVLDEDYYRKGLSLSHSLPQGEANMVPAEQGRNHMATQLPPPATTP